MSINYYANPTELAHEIEKLQIQLAAQRQEIEHLREINALLKEKKA